MATYNFNIKVITEKDLRREIVEMLAVNALRNMNVSVEASGTEKPVSVEIVKK